jgi:hypothetical protein
MRGGGGDGGRANMTRGFDNDDYRSYEDREYHNSYCNPQNSRTHFSRPRDPLLFPIFTTDLLAIMAYTPELGKSVGCDRKDQGMDFLL